MTEKVKLDIRSLVGEKLYEERFADKEIQKKKVGDKRQHQSINQIESKKVKHGEIVRCCDPLQNDQDASGSDDVKTVGPKITCNGCGKFFARTYCLYRHRYYCKALIQTLKLEWNGESWMKTNHRIYYQLQLGHNLINLIEKGAVKEDDLNCTQREYVKMYKKLFIE